MKSLTILRLQWLVGCALVLQSTDSVQTIAHYFFAPPNVSPPGVYSTWLVFNAFALLFRLTVGYLFLFGFPALGFRVAALLFLGFRAVIKLFSAPLLLLHWHEGILQPYRAEDIVDGLITGAVVCCVFALIVAPKDGPNHLPEATRGGRAAAPPRTSSGAPHR